MKIFKNKVLTAAGILLLAAGQLLAEAVDNLLPVEMDACALALGREFPGAKGSLAEDEKGNVVLNYDFSGGGRYVGAELALPVSGMKSFTVTAEPKQEIRASLVVLQPGNQIETRRKHYKAGECKITVDGNTEFIQPDAKADGSAAKVRFRVEKSANTPEKGSVVLKSISYFGEPPKIVIPSQPDSDAPVKEQKITPSVFHRSHGLEYPGSKTMQIMVPEGVRLEYDFTKGGRYVGGEIDLDYAGGRHFEIIFDAPHRVKVFGRALHRGGFYETKAQYFDAGKDLKFSISANGPWRQVRGPGSKEDELGGNIERAMLCIEKAPGTPVTGSVTYKKVVYYGAETPKGHRYEPADEMPEPVYLWNSKNLKGVKNPELKPGIPGMYAADVRLGDTEIEIDRTRLNPESFTISAWIYPGESGSSHGNDGGMYRNIVRKQTVGSFMPNNEIQFSLCKMVPLFGFQDERGIWGGVMRYGKDFRSGLNGQELKPIIGLPRVTPGKWSLITATFDAGTIRTYINDEFILESRYPNRKRMYFSDSPLKLGNLYGMVDNLAIYDKALKPDEVSLLYRQTKPQYDGKKAEFSRRSDEFLGKYDRHFNELLPITAEYLKNMPAMEKYAHIPAFTLGMHKGQVMIHRDGKPETSFCVVPVPDWFPKSAETVADFAAADTPYVQLVFTNSNGGGWGDSKDFSDMEKKLDEIIKYHPNSRILIRTRLSPPSWWKSKYRAEADRAENGKTSNEPSMSSDIWLKDAGRALRAQIEHLESHPVYGPRIAGYIIGGGRANEWYWFASNRGWIDYNPKNVQRFRKWLKEYYKGDLAAFRKAWRNKKVTFETAKIPSGKLRGASEYGFFRDIKRSRPVSDHLRYMSDVISGDISYLAAEARKSLKTPKLLGVFNGYSTWHDDLSNQGFQNFHKVVADPNIDFITAPVCYHNRRAGFAGDYMNGFTGSMRLHGKLYYDEADMRTHLCDDTNVYKTTTPEETRSVHWRSWGNAVTQGTTLWWLLLAGNSTFHDRDLIDDIARMSRYEQKAVTLDRSPVAEVAVFCDDESILYVNAKQKDFHAFNREARERLAHIGAPMDFYLLSDIDNPGMPDYKIYVFLNAYYMTPEKREAIQKKLAKNKAVAVWCHAPGYLSPSKGNSYSTMKELTGFTFEDTFKVSRRAMELTEAGRKALPCTASAAKEEYSLSPLFYIKPDKNDTVWGNIGNLPVLATRREAFGTSIFTAVPPTAALLRDLCRDNGIHIYIDSGDVLRANATMVMVHASSAGVKKVNIPWKGAVKELISGKTFKRADRIEMPMTFGQTAIFVPAE